MYSVNDPNPYLVLTSTLFIIPAFIAGYYKFWLESSACILISFISSIHHAYRTNYTYILDQLACYYLAYVFYMTCAKLNVRYAWYIGVGYSITVYNIGKLFNILTWDPDYIISTLWHISMHIFILYMIMYVLFKKISHIID
jgi:hypothetical protein